MTAPLEERGLLSEFRDFVQNVSAERSRRAETPHEPSPHKPTPHKPSPMKVAKAALFLTNLKKTGPCTRARTVEHPHYSGLGRAPPTLPADSDAPSWTESGLLATLTFT